jgi:hypothetical protein
MKYDMDRKKRIPDSLMPGPALDEVVENTGFDVRIDAGALVVK